GIAALTLGVYIILRGLNIPLNVQPQLFGLFALLSSGQCLHYVAAQSRTCTLVQSHFRVDLWSALEVAFVFALRVSCRVVSYVAKRHRSAIVQSSRTSIFCVFETQFYEIYKYRAVLGISLTFMTISYFGGILSKSLALKHRFDAIAAVTY
ncbi:hypothetical protein BGW80DRAFT_1108491, partial [Lactifluus volemus]